jgi:hypothetical protein
MMHEINLTQQRGIDTHVLRATLARAVGPLHDLR